MQERLKISQVMPDLRQKAFIKFSEASNGFLNKIRGQLVNNSSVLQVERSLSLALKIYQKSFSICADDTKLDKKVQKRVFMNAISRILPSIPG